MMSEMFADLPPEHEFFEQFSFISANELPEFGPILSTVESGGIAASGRPSAASCWHCRSS